MPVWLTRAILRIRATFSSQRDRELERELDLHLSLLEEEYRSQGMTADQARRHARRDFGNPTLIRESSHDLFSFRPVEDFVRDFQYALRELRRSAAFTVIVVASLAIGIGAATATFAMADAFFWRPLPVRDPQRLVAFAYPSNQHWGMWSYAGFTRWQQASHGIGDVAASGELTLDLVKRADERQQQGSVALVSTNYFHVLGADMAMGLGFADHQAVSRDTPSAVAVISHAFWQRWFGGTSEVLSRTIDLRGIRYAIIGVTGRGFAGHTVGQPTDIWVPLTQPPALKPFPGSLNDAAGKEVRWLHVIARLQPHVNRQSAASVANYVRQAFVDEKAAVLGQQDPEVVRDRRDGVMLVSAAQGDTGIAEPYVRPVMILGAITALVLIVACTNFTNLMFARSEARRVEFMIRLALGGGRWRLIRQAATECLGLALIAGAVGLLFASWATRIALSRLNELAPIDLALNLNIRVLGFAAACIAVSTICGLWPCLTSARSALVSSTQQIAGVSRNGSSSPVTSRLILVAQLTICAVVLIAAGLLLRTVVNLRTQDLGIERDVLLIRTAAVDGAAAGTSAAVEEMRRRLTAMPGVKAVGVVGSAVMDPSEYWIDGTQTLTTDRGVVLPGRRWTLAGAGPGFFEAVGMRLVRGSVFSEGVRADVTREPDPNVVVLNQSLARFLFGGDDPIGRRISLSRRGPLQTVIGVVADARQVSPRDRGLGVVYQPLKRFENVTLAVRAIDGVSPAAIRRQIESAPQVLRLGSMTTIADELDRAIARERLMSGISLFLASLVVVIGCVGLYALMSYEVARRSRELGIRLALGASASQVMRLVLRDGVRLVVPALAIGLPLGIAVSRWASSQFYDVSPGDPSTLIVVATLLSLVSLAATLRPARAASRIDPLVLLRND
jgi:predicted permease